MSIPIAGCVVISEQLSHLPGAKGFKCSFHHQHCHSTRGCCPNLLQLLRPDTYRNFKWEEVRAHPSTFAGNIVPLPLGSEIIWRILLVGVSHTGLRGCGCPDCWRHRTFIESTCFFLGMWWAQAHLPTLSIPELQVAS